MREIRKEAFGTTHYSKTLDRNILINEDQKLLINSLPELHYLLQDVIDNKESDEPIISYPKRKKDSK